MTYADPGGFGSWRDFWPRHINKALLLLRVVVGLLFMGHASQKLFGWFGGEGIGMLVGTLSKADVQPAPMWAYFEAGTELVAGALLVLGFLTPIAAAALIGDMLVAAILVHAPKGLWSQFGGYEYNLVLITVLAAIGLIGPGTYSIDGQIAYPIQRHWLFGAALAVTLVLVGVVLLT